MQPQLESRRRRRGRPRWLLIIGLAVIVLCAVAGLLLSTLFAGATVTVFPRVEQVPAPRTLIAKLNPTTGELGYQTMTVTRTASTTVEASGTRQVSRSASGVVTVYNAYSEESQRLIANTRFEAPDGKMYRIRESVVVPGAIKGANGQLTPGAVTVTVYANSPGESYNRGETRFTIPGFKDDPRYSKFYATTNAITGGLVGTEAAVAQADLNRASDALKQALSQAAQNELAAQIPAGYAAIPGTLQVTFSDLTQSPGPNGTAIVSQSATMTGAILQANNLAAAIAKESVQGYGGEAVAFADIQELSVASATTTKAGESITLALSGTPKIIWQFDPDALKNALIGKSKDSFQTIVESFEPAISRAEAKVRPFWEGNFPGDPKKIEVTVSTQ
ncbi:MAG TPA: hypothetical protein VD928_01465 [Candidatus Paceibacterota bacterium]|nr:hypothetical protein [Candidatus Paceibacterota bacterium]